MKQKKDQDDNKNHLQFEFTVDHIGLGVGYYTPEGKIISFNKVAAAHMGGKPEDFTGKMISDLFSNDLAKIYLSRIKKCLEAKEAISFIDEVPLPTGKKWFKSTYNKVYSNDQIIGIIIISDEITSLKKAEKTIEDEKKKYSALIENINTGIALHEIITDENNKPIDFVFLHVNKMYEELTLLQASEIIGKRGKEVIPSLEQKWIDLYGDVALSGIPKHIIDHSEYLNKYWDIKAYSPFPRQFAVGLNDITELKKKEILEDSFFNQPNVIHLVGKTDGTIVKVNNGCFDILGYNINELIGKSIFSIIHPDDLPSTKKEIEKLNQGKNTFHFENRYRHKNGEYIYLRWSANVNLQEQLIFGTAFDISELKKAEKEIQSAYELLSDTEKIAKSGSWTSNPITGEGSWSKGSYAIRGASSDIYGSTKSHESFMHPEDIKPYRKQFEINIKSRENEFKQQYRLIDSLGNIKHIEAHYEIQRDEKGDAIFITGIDKDITELINAQEELNKTKEEYKALSDASFESIFISKKGVCIGQNKTAETTFGYSNEEAIGKPGTDWIIPEDREMVMNKMMNNVTKSYRATALKKDGTTFPCEIQAKTFIEKGKTIRYTALRDISERVNAEKALIESEERFHLAMEAAQDGLFDWNLLTNEIYFSPRYKKMLGYEDNELPNDFSVWEQLTAPEDVKESWKKLEAHLKGETNRFEMEFKMKHKNGHYIDILSRANAVFNKDGKATRIVGTHLDISESIQLQKTLQYQKDLTQKYLDVAGTMLVAIDNDQKVTLINPKACEILGYNKEDIIGKNWFDHFLPQKGVDDIKNVFNTAIKGNIEFVEYYENPILTKSRQERIIAWHNSVIKDENGQIIRLFSSGNDITEEKKMTERLMDSEEKYKALYMNAPLAYQSLNINGRIIDVNPQWLKTLGYERNEVLGKYFGDFLNEDSKSHFRKKFPIFKKKGHVSGVRFHMLTKTGTEIIVSFEGCIGYTKTGEFRQTYCTFKEITSEVLANNKLLAAAKSIEISERKFRELFDKSADAVFIIKDEVINDCNEASLSLFGYKNKADLIGKSPLDFSPIKQPDNRSSSEKMIDVIKKARINGTNRFEWLHTNKNGKEFPCEVLLTYLGKNEKGHHMTHGVMRDITNRKSRELDIIKAKEQAEESDRLKSAFLANMSHEIRTPMNGILGFAELLKEPQLEEGELEQYVAVIERSGKRMLNIINDLIDISKIEAQQMEIQLSETFINDQIKYLHKFFTPEANGKNIDLIIHTPLKKEESRVLTDREKIYAILTNLIKNAIKYTEQGKIEFGYKTQKTTLEFFVSDTGKGIPKEIQPLIFDRFIQAEMEHTRRYEGAGLGLAISKAYVEMLGGKIWVESKYGVGSTFYFTLPLKK